MDFKLYSTGFVVPEDGPSYVFAIYSRGWIKQGSGIATIEAITNAVDRALTSDGC